MNIIFTSPGSVSFEEGESEAESSNMDTNNPVFQLFEAVRGARNSQGQIFSDPFQQLPSRREYPDYYQQIKQPICLQQIRCDVDPSSLVELSQKESYRKSIDLHERSVGIKGKDEERGVRKGGTD